MKLSREQIENMESEDIEKIIKNAIESRDMEFLTSTLPDVHEHFIIEGESFWTPNYFLSNFDHDVFKDRDIALMLVKLGQEIPKDLYENDEEMILAAVSVRGCWLNGFALASDKYINDKEFVKKMIVEIDDYDLSDVLFNLEYNLVPEHVLEDGEIEQIVRNRFQELKEKKTQYKENEVADESEKSSKLEQLASTKKALEQTVSELRKNIASAQKLLASYEELLNEEKRNDSNDGQTFGEE